MWFLKNIKARTLWIITGIILLLVIGLVILIPIVDKAFTTVIVVFMVIGFVLLTILIQVASYKTFKFKPKTAPTKVVEFETEVDIIQTLKKNKYKERNKSFGVSFLKVSKPNAFKVTIINDIEAYFNPTDSDASQSDKELDNCDRMIGLEIFLNYREEDLPKFKDYSLQGNNIYYTCLYKVDDNKYICPNYIEPVENHKKNFDALFNELGLVLKNSEEN